jgi:hypothetical protein
MNVIGSGNRIVTVAAPRMTAEDPAKGEITAFERTMLPDGFDSVL